MRTQHQHPMIPDYGNILMFDESAGLDLRNELQRREESRQMEAERMAAIGMMVCSISHDMRHSLSAIYANVEFLEHRDICESTRVDLLFEIQEAVQAMTERIDSLLHFGGSGRNSPLIPARVSTVLEKSIAAVKSRADGQNVSISVGEVPSVDADIDPRNLESAIYNLLLNACQAAASSSHVPEVNVDVVEIDEQIYVTISDNGPGIPARIRRSLFNPFVTADKPNGTGLGLTLVRRIAEEHGGSACLVESKPGRTVFRLSLSKNPSSR